MNCPVCRTAELKMSERQGVEIDYCPSCRGVWLDRGELDKIIDRAAAELPAPAGRVQAPPAQRQAAQPSSMDDSDYGKYRYKRRKHWLLEIFD